jgi:hypothetical protein
MTGLLGATRICLRNLDKGDMRESSGKLSSRKRESLRFNLFWRMSNLGPRWRSPDLILNGYILKNLLLFYTTYYTKLCLVRSATYLARTGTSRTRTIPGCRPVASAGTLPDHYEAAKNYSNPSQVVHITFQGASLEAFSRKLMVPHYCQSADSLSPANSEFPMNSA